MIYTNAHKRLLTKTIYWIRLIICLIIWRWTQDVGRYNLGALKPDTNEWDVIRGVMISEEMFWYVSKEGIRKTYDPRKVETSQNQKRSSP